MSESIGAGPPYSGTMSSSSFLAIVETVFLLVKRHSTHPQIRPVQWKAFINQVLLNGGAPVIAEFTHALKW